MVVQVSCASNGPWVTTDLVARADCVARVGARATTEVGLDQGTLKSLGFNVFRSNDLDLGRLVHKGWAEDLP
jgi:hypothetical protein